MFHEIRKKIKKNNASILAFIGCSPKQIYIIEKEPEKNYHIRYLMYLRKNKININHIIDELNKIESTSAEEIIK